MKRCILHVGYGKTGTTALQAFLARNRDRLRKLGTLYPDLRSRDLPLNLENHNLVAAAVARKSGKTGLAAEAIFSQIFEQANARDIEQIILSAEGFTGHPNVLLYDNEAAYRADETAYISRLRSLLGKSEVQVLVYLRRQDLWLDSMANQRIKFEGRNAGPPFTTIDDFFRRLAPRLDYDRSLAAWSEVFGAENLIVRPYERPALRNGSIIDDFLEQIGLEYFEGVPVPAHDLAASNTRLSRDVIAYKISLDITSYPRWEREFLGEALREISAEMGGETLPLVTPALARKILDACAEGNAKIARTYLGRPDGRLFLAPEPDGTEHADTYNGLDPDVAKEIEARLTAKRRSMAGRRRRLELRLSETVRRLAPKGHGALRYLRHRLRPRH